MSVWCSETKSVPHPSGHTQPLTLSAMTPAHRNYIDCVPPLPYRSRNTGTAILANKYYAILMLLGTARKEGKSVSLF